MIFRGFLRKSRIRSDKIGFDAQKQVVNKQKPEFLNSGIGVFMADMKNCPMCGYEILAASRKCPCCCEFLDDAARYESILKDRMLAPKSRLVYILLGLFMGRLGLHDFYAGYHSEGRIKIALLLFSPILGLLVSIAFNLPQERIFFCCLFWGIGWGISWIGTLFEICTVKKDASGRPLV